MAISISNKMYTNFLLCHSATDFQTEVEKTVHQSYQIVATILFILSPVWTSYNADLRVNHNLLCGSAILIFSITLVKLFWSILVKVKYIQNWRPLHSSYDYSVYFPMGNNRASTNTFVLLSEPCWQIFVKECHIRIV